MRKLLVYILVEALCVVMSVATAQDMRYVELPNQGQLPVANIHRVMQDSEGYMWYGTEGGGLCRDDGYHVEVFRTDCNNPDLLTSNDITAIAEDSCGRIWFGTRDGAYILDKRDYKIRRLKEKTLEGKAVNCIAVSSDGAVWIGSTSLVLKYSSEGRFVKSYHSKWRGRLADVSNMLIDSKGVLWCTQWNGGLFSIDTRNGKVMERDWTSPFSPNYMAEDKRQGGYWIGTWGGGVVRYKADKKNALPVIVSSATPPSREGVFSGKLLSVLYDESANQLWAVSMDDIYAYRIDGDRLTPVDMSHFLPKGKKILDNMLRDRQGNIWVPSYSPHTFILSHVRGGIRRDPVKPMSDATGYRVMVDRIVCEGDYYWIWQGRTRLSLYDARNGHMIFASGDAVPSVLNPDKCIEPCSVLGGVWTCVGNQLVRAWNENMSIHWERVEEVLLRSPINALCDDRASCLYIGTDDGVYCFNYMKNECKELARDTSPVCDLAVDNDGTVYFATDKWGLSCVRERGKVRRMGEGTEVSVVAVGDDGTVWAANKYGNVYSFAKNSSVAVEDGKAGNKNGDAVKDLATDSYGHVWILSDQYLKEYSPQNGSIRIIRSSDRDVDMDYFHTLGVKGDSVCLGGIGALCVIAPSGELDSEVAGILPQVTALTVNGEKRFLSVGEKELNLSPDSTDVEVFLSTFDFLNIADIRFAWRMAGRDEEWTALPAGQNSVHLSDLPKGQFVLEVKATDKYGVWGEPAECFVLNRRPAWFETWWAYTLYALIVLSACGAVVFAVRRKKRPSLDCERAECGDERDVEVETHDGPMDAEGGQDAGIVSPQESQSEAELTQIDRDFLAKASAIVERNLDNADYSVEQFGIDMCMSRMNLYRKLQTLTGQSPSEYIRGIRLEKAASLLTSSGLSVSEISDKVGFSSPRYFSRCFKEKYGVLPKRYK